jgi:CRISPR-associated protein (TIGR03984 family)
MNCKPHHLIQPVDISEICTSNLSLLLSAKARAFDLSWLLAHADDGIIWGEFRADGLHTSSEAFPDISPPLRTETLQQMRLFGPLAELLIWREASNWHARLIKDDAGMTQEFIDEAHLLWGNTAEKKKDGFVLLREGEEGLRHAPPLNCAEPLPKKLKAPAFIKVRHYIAYDEDGQAYITFSRLVTIGGGE